MIPRNFDVSQETFYRVYTRLLLKGLRKMSEVVSSVEFMHEFIDDVDYH